MNGVLPLMAFVLAWSLGSSLSAVDDERGARDLLSKKCLSCHSTAKHKGDVDLEKLPAPGVSADGDDRWESVRRALASQDMPPPEKTQPSVAERDAMVAWIDRRLDGPGGDTPTDPGWVTVHRLTRTEFNRTITDLLGVSGNPADAFPADNAGGSGSFDNNADTLYVSPILMERLLDVSLNLISQTKAERLNLVEPEKDKKGAIAGDPAQSCRSIAHRLPAACVAPTGDQARGPGVAQGLRSSSKEEQRHAR